MLKREGLVLLGAAALVLVVAVAGCTPELRKRVFDGFGRVAASPTLPTLISEVAAILLSDEWRAALEVKARQVGRDRVRAAVAANAEKPAVGPRPDSHVSASRVARPEGEARFSPETIIQSRALLWIADDDRAASLNREGSP